MNSTLAAPKSGSSSSSSAIAASSTSGLNSPGRPLRSSFS
jgi:hypothetical protein